MRHLAVGLAVLVLTLGSTARARSLSDVLEGPDVCMAAPTLTLPIPPRITPDEEVLEDLAKAGRHWRIETERGPVHVWIPENYDPGDRRDDRIRSRLPHRCRPGVDRLPARCSSSR